MTVISISATTDYRSQPVDDVTALTYTSSPKASDFFSAVFDVGQLDLGRLVTPDFHSAGALITGNFLGNGLVIHTTGLAGGDIEYLRFSNWSASDSVQIFGGSGADLIHGTVVSCSIFGGDGDDSLLISSNTPGCKLDGGAGNDVLYGGAADDLLLGGDGNDTFNWVGGADTVEGGSGIDTLQNRLSGLVLPAALNIDIRDGGAGRDVGNGLTLSGIERLRVDASAQSDRIIGGDLRDILDGKLGDDLLQGQGGSDLLIGDAGNDTLSGETGSDLLLGGAGADRLSGGAGADRFIFRQISDSGVAGNDVITDFVQGQDKIDFMIFPIDLHFIGQASFVLPRLETDQEIRYEKLAKSTLVQIGNFSDEGDVVRMQIKLLGAFDLTMNDFIF